MLTISTTPDEGYLLRLAEKLLQNDATGVQTAMALVKKVGENPSIWFLRVRIANKLISKGFNELAGNVISGIDVTEYIRRYSKAREIKTLFSVLISLNRGRNVLEILESNSISSLVQKVDDFDIRFKAASRLVKNGQMSKADEMIASVDVEKIYAENPSFKDGYARIGWIKHWPKENYEKVIQWFGKDLCHSSDSCESAPISRLSPEWRINYARAVAANGDIRSAEKQVKIAYAESSSLKDGYSRVAWQYFYEKEDYSSLCKWIDKDDSSNRLSVNWRMKQAIAVAKAKGIEASIPLIEAIYEKNGVLQNVFTKVAWAYLKPENMAYEKLIHYLEKDRKAGKLDADGQLIYARALALIGREEDAVECVKIAYRNDRRITNGFAQIGYFSSFLFNYDPEKALKWFVMDQDKGRLHGQFLQHMVTLYAAAGDVESATSMVDGIYKNDSKAVNGYSLIGWYGCMVHKHDPEGALSFFERDRKLQRMQPRIQNFLGNTGNLLAGIYAFLGDRRKAECSIPLTREDNTRIIGGHAIVGFCDFYQQRDFNYLVSMLEKEKGDECFSRPFLSYLYASTLLKTGERKIAIRYIRDAAQRSALASDLAKAWLRGMAYTEEDLKMYFVTNELESMFMEHIQAKTFTENRSLPV